MEITFASPTFFSPADEAMFFAWLERVPGFLSVVGRGRELTATLGNEREGAVRELLVIFRRWQIDLSPLVPFRSEDPYPSPLWENEIPKVIGGV